MENETKLSPRILVVDDEEIILDSFKDLLEMSGYEVDTFLNPIEALAFFEKCRDKIDLVLTDGIMPKMSGVEFATKARENRKKIKIILMSALPGAAQEEAEASEIKFDDLFDAILQKPFEIEVLRKTVENLLPISPNVAKH